MDQAARKLKKSGMILFFFGLITGFLMMNLKNPRMGLAAHLEAVMNGAFLVIVGLIWNELKLSQQMRKLTYLTLNYGAFMNWFITLLAAFLGTSKMTPITGLGYSSTIFRENLVNAGFISVGLTMIFSLIVLIYGLRNSTIRLTTVSHLNPVPKVGAL